MRILLIRILLFLWCVFVIFTVIFIFFQFFNEYYNTEHSRMLNLWKDIVAMKRNFTEIQSLTQRDLSKLRNEVSSVSNEMVATCSGFLTSTTQSMISGVSRTLFYE